MWGLVRWTDKCLIFLNFSSCFTRHIEKSASAESKICLFTIIEQSAESANRIGRVLWRVSTWDVVNHMYKLSDRIYLPWPFFCAFSSFVRSCSPRLSICSEPVLQFVFHLPYFLPSYLFSDDWNKNTKEL